MSFTSSFLQLDGIEFKISDSLQTPNVDFGLPSNFRMSDPSVLMLESEYDFSKEREILDRIKSVREAEKKIAEQEERRKQQSLKRRANAEKQRLEEMMNQQREVLQRQRELFLEKKRKQKENMKNGEDSTPERMSPNEESTVSSRTSPTSESVSEVPPPIPPRNPFLQVGKDDILTPQPAARKNKDPPSPSQKRTNGSQPVLTGQSQIWVDFEDKELDPFTNMELKTIDDMAELQTVLQNAKLGDPPPLDVETSIAENSDYLPSYDEATSPAHNTTPKEAATSRNSSPEINVENTTPKPDPLLDVQAISFSILNSGDEASTGEKTVEDESGPLYENVKEMTDNVPETTGQANDILERKSPEFVMPENPESLYENVTLSQVNKIAKELDNPSSHSSSHHSTQESWYDFGSESAILTLEDNKKALQPQPLFEKTSAKKMKENVPAGPSTLYSIVKPKDVAVKSPDEPTTSSIQSFPVHPHSSGPGNPFLTNQFPSQPPSSNIAPPLLPRQTRSRPDPPGTPPITQISTMFPPPVQYTQSGGSKVLPVSFGEVSNSLSATVLPPITTATTNGGTYRNLTAGSISTPNLTQAPTPMPRKPPVPPRDPIASTNHAPATQNQFNIRPPQPSSPNGPTHPISTAGHSHLLPPYALPQPNGQSVSKPSTTQVISNRKPSPPPQKSTPAPSSVDTSFLQKSQDDRAKFAETVNKALSSLPKNPPKPIVTHKPTTPAAHENSAHPPSKSQAFSNYQRLPSRNSSIKSSLLVGLSSEEQEFVNNITAIGFDTRATIRATQKYGLNHEEVIDHLCRVQDLSDQGYPVNTIQDALESFKNDNKSVIKYIQQACQLIDMGFKEDDVREALQSNNNDQTKALDQLMGTT